MTDPRPAATEAAVSDDSVLGEVAQIIDEAIDRHLHVSDDVELPGNDIVDDIIHTGFVIVRLNAAPAPPSGQVCVSVEDLEAAIDAMGYVKETYFWTKWGYQEPYDRLVAALKGAAR